MRAMAEFIMRGRMQATLVVAGCAALPLLYWLGAAAGCLVLLRRGLKDALGVLALGLLPALIWWLYSDDPRALLVLLGSASLALVLRASESWNRVLLVSIAMGVVFSVVLGTAFGPQIEMLAQALIKVMPSLLGDVYQQVVGRRASAFRVPDCTDPDRPDCGLVANRQCAEPDCRALLAGVVVQPGWFWSRVSRHPNPAGSRDVAAGGACLWHRTSVPQMSMLIPLCSVPLVFAGLALIHGLVAQKRLARFWLVGLYVTLLLFMQLIYPLLVVLAIVDSLIDFRGRLAPKDADDANGEG